MRAELHQPLSALGLLLVYSTFGFLLLNLSLGRVLDLIGLRWTLVVGSFLYALSLSLLAFGSWPVIGSALVNNRPAPAISKAKAASRRDSKLGVFTSTPPLEAV